MSLRTTVLLFSLPFLILTSLSCSSSTATGPGDTDFPNTRTITGKVVHGEDSPVSFTEVRLIADDHLPTKDDAVSCSTVDSTNSSGIYSFSVSGTGLQAVHFEKRTRLLVRSIRVYSDDDTFLVNDHSLGRPGAIEVTLPEDVATRTGYNMGFVSSLQFNIILSNINMV